MTVGLLQDLGFLPCRGALPLRRGAGHLLRGLDQKDASLGAGEKFFKFDGGL